MVYLEIRRAARRRRSPRPRSDPVAIVGLSHISFIFLKKVSVQSSGGGEVTGAGRRSHASLCTASGWFPLLMTACLPSTDVDHHRSHYPPHSPRHFVFWTGHPHAGSARQSDVERGVQRLISRALVVHGHSLFAHLPFSHVYFNTSAFQINTSSRRSLRSRLFADGATRTVTRQTSRFVSHKPKTLDSALEVFLFRVKSNSAGGFSAPGAAFCDAH